MNAELMHIDIFQNVMDALLTGTVLMGVKIGANSVGIPPCASRHMTIASALLFHLYASTSKSRRSTL